MEIMVELNRTKATFQVLANIRKRLCDKLAKVPLGKVKDTPSGALKNIIVERVDKGLFNLFRKCKILL